MWKWHHGNRGVLAALGWTAEVYCASPCKIERTIFQSHGILVCTYVLARARNRIITQEAVKQMLAQLFEFSDQCTEG